MELSFRKVKKTLIVSLSGEIDHHSAGKTSREIDRRFSLSGASDMVLDFGRLTFMDSSGLGIIIGRYKTLSALGGKLSIASPPEQVKKIIGLAGLDKIISVYGTADAALKGM